MVVAGVSPVPSLVSNTASGAAPHVNAAWVTLVVEQMIFAMGVEAGYFQKYGVDFTLSYINQSTNGIAGIASHSLDMIIGSGAAAVSAQSGGEDVLVGWTFIGKPPFRLMATAGIDTVDEVKGKTAVVGRVGSSTDYFYWLALTQYLGWSQDDVQYVSGGDQLGQIALLQTGQVQALLAEAPVDLLDEDAGAHQLFDMTTTDIPYAGAATILSRAFLASNRAAVLGVAKGCVEAVHRWKTDADFTKAVIEKYLQPQDPRYSQDGWEAFKDVFAEEPFVSRDAMQAVIGQVAAQTPAAASVDVDKTFDNSIVQELVDSGFIEQLYGA